MKSVAFFNNKGGVGKTTLACNLSSYLATNLRKRVLLIDCDPQCNSTQLMLDQEICEKLYWDKGSSSNPDTLIKVVAPIDSGDAGINASVTPVLGTSTRFGIDLIPGHPRMSIIEDKLSQAWATAAGGDIGGLRITNWASSLLASLAPRYDLVVFDLGPSLGSLNRSVLAASQHFVTPMGCDIFSIVGIRNIADWFGAWLSLYDNGISICKKRHPGKIEEFGLPERLKIANGYIGFTVQQYITKSKQGVRRPTAAFEAIIKQIPSEVQDSLGTFSPTGTTGQQMRLGDVPHMFSLVPLAQNANSPIRDLSSKDGLVGSQFAQAETYGKVIGQVARKFAAKIGLVESK